MQRDEVGPFAGDVSGGRSVAEDPPAVLCERFVRHHPTDFLRVSRSTENVGVSDDLNHNYAMRILYHMQKKP